MSRCLRAATVACGLLLVLSSWPQANSARTEDAASVIRGSWYQSTRNPDGGVFDLYQTFADEKDWTATAVFLDKAGKTTRRRAWGTFRITPVGDHAYQLVTRTDDWSPRHICVDKTPCETAQGFSPGFGNITFPDPDHFGAPGQSNLAVRMQHLPIEATAPVPHIVMLTAAGEPSDAPPPIGLDSLPGSSSRRQCDNLQQQRICTINDGSLYIGHDGCQHCSR